MRQASEDGGLLTRFLEENDAPCPVCGYNLRHLTGAKCPECGAAMELRVGSADLKLGTWIALLLTLAIPLELTTIVLGATATKAMIGAVADGDAWHLGFYLLGMWPLIVQWGLNALLLLAAIGWRQRLWKQRRWAQRLWLWGAVVLMGATLVASLWLMGAR